MDITKHPQLYKKKSLNDTRNRPTSNLSNTEKTRVEIVIGKFFELFKSKHL
jgi:hypothetical protein